MSSQAGQSQAAQGLIVSVLRDGRGDCSRGGLTAEHQELTVVNVDGPFGPADDRPVVIGMVRRRDMTWIALDQHVGTLSRHDSEAGAVDIIEVAAGVKR